MNDGANIHGGARHVSLLGWIHNQPRLGGKRPPPPIALTATTASGGASHIVNSTNPMRATPKSPGPLTEVVQTGLYSAAPSSPTTAALTPRVTACAFARLRNAAQNGSAAMSASMPGRKIATRLMAAPATPCGGGFMTAPR